MYNLRYLHLHYLFTDADYFAKSSDVVKDLGTRVRSYLAPLSQY